VSLCWSIAVQAPESWSDTTRPPPRAPPPPRPPPLRRPQCWGPCRWAREPSWPTARTVRSPCTPPQVRSPSGTSPTHRPASLSCAASLASESGSAALSTVHRQTVRGPLAANGCCATLTSTSAAKVAFGGRENDLTLFDCSDGGGELKQVRLDLHRGRLG
jgi:hypothetical protein